MTTEKKKPCRLTKALLETAKDMRDGEILNTAAYKKITVRHLGKTVAPPEPLTGDDIRALRERLRMSQAVFANLLNVTVGYPPEPPGRASPDLYGSLVLDASAGECSVWFFTYHSMALASGEALL